MKNKTQIISQETLLTLLDSQLDNIDDLFLEPHFNLYTSKFMNSLIKAWSVDDPENPDGLKQALQYLHNAINFDHETFQVFLAEQFGENPQDASLIKTRDALKVLSTQCSGNIQETDPIWRLCRDMSLVPDGELKSKIGSFFKERSNIYLKERYHIYDEIQKRYNQTNAESEIYLG